MHSRAALLQARSGAPLIRTHAHRATSMRVTTAEYGGEMESHTGGLGSSNRLLEGLTPAQRQAVCSEGAPLCILAGPGSGKTRVLTRRIAWRIETGAADAAHVLALTFTRKAAGELRRRLAELGVRDQVAAGTFHSVAYAQLRQLWSDRGVAAPVLLERKAGLLSRLVEAGQYGAPSPQSGSTGLSSGRAWASGAARARALGDLAGEIEWAKARLLLPRDYPAASADAGRRPTLPTPEVAALYAAYEAEKAKRHLIDFDDLLSQAARAMETDAAFAAAQRWRFRHLFVDEYQDVNPAQARLLRSWLGEHTDLCVVGDPRQAIYGWNGADPAALANITRYYPDANVVNLDDNWRSSPQILAVASAVLSHGKPTRQTGKGAIARGLRANRPDGPVPTIWPYESDRAEALGIARGLRRAHRPGRTWRQMAVLVRTNAQLTLIEEALQRAGIPHRVRSGQAFLAHPVVHGVLDRLCAAPLPFNTILADLATLVAEVGDGASLDDMDGSLRTLLGLAHEYHSLDRTANGSGFLAWLGVTVGSGGNDSSRDAVELATFHGAKGLEWPCVFVAGLEQGLVPIGQATTPAAQAEEQRLLYVALTRAEHELHCSWAQHRTFGERVVRRGPSPYLEAIEISCRTLAGCETADQERAAGHIATARNAIPAGASALAAGNGTATGNATAGAGGSAGASGIVGNSTGSGRTVAGRPALRAERPATALARSADPEVIEVLRAWRSATARASGVPAHVILHDVTLAAVASASPRSAEELIALPGIGPVKGARYGPVILDLLAEHRRASA